MLALFSGLRMPWTLLGWVALVPWLALVDRARTRREALWLGLALSVVFSAAVFGWFAGAVQAYSQAPLWVCWVALLLMAPVVQLQFPLAALARYDARRVLGMGWWGDSRPDIRVLMENGTRASAGGSARGSDALRAGAGVRLAWLPPVVTALAYVASEWFAPKLFADTLGLGLVTQEWMRQGADLAGAPGLTLLLLLGNECVLAAFQALRNPERRHRAVIPLGIGAALVLALTGYGAFRYSQVTQATRREPGFVVGAVQANITNYEKLKAERGTYDVVRMILDTHYEMSDALLRSAPVDFLVWPETVYPTTFGTPRSEAGAELDAEIAGYVAQRGVPLVFGTYDLDGEREFNAAMFLGPDARGERLEHTAYRKTMLFPLTEWVPDAIDTPMLREWLPWTGRWKRGPGPKAVSFRLRDGRSLTVAPLICYESIFPSYVADSVRKGAELLLTLSNDSWFSGTPAPRLHLAHAAFRSIETRRPQVRVTNSGVSALIDATGTVLAEVDDNQRSGLVMRVPTTAPLSSLALAWGNWLGPVAAVLTFVLVTGAHLYRRRAWL
ncbi:apolipoprotein N-acyltransferase [Pyxidicoccus parkwayensis]|uniref:Apolipoprotein N-acyltransferase n=1 Tax=Pyxidicoccus parkwayensis TaxID=2813578 RepID=A0ABX7PDD0_9BACT|nr:apolipoprotein N-acyltransferase [Pyxidicoccus parkwaysis]QSQ28458.1 apolipoprotein N-acyltransferase [Pyxidicoccus parkwaysis]